MRKVYDEEKIVYLYKKYGTIEDVRCRLNMSIANIKKILEKNNIEINKNVRKKTQIRYGRFFS